jgi:hypothetical protein
MLGDPAKHVNLNQSNDDFLEKDLLNVHKMIPHDDIHELVKYGAQPRYKAIKVDQSKAMCDRKLFEALPHEEKLENVFEEAMTLALERFLLPEREISSQVAYTKALQKICTTTTKGWFRDFAINHYMQLKDCPKDLRAIARRVITEYNAQEELKRLAEYKIDTNSDTMKEWFSDSERKWISENIKWPPDLVVQKRDTYDRERIRYYPIEICGRLYKIAVWEEYNSSFELGCETRYGSELQIRIDKPDSKERTNTMFREDCIFKWSLQAYHSVGSYESNRGSSKYLVTKSEWLYSENLSDAKWSAMINGDLLFRFVIATPSTKFQDSANTDALIAIYAYVNNYARTIEYHLERNDVPCNRRMNKTYRASLVAGPED